MPDPAAPASPYPEDAFIADPVALAALRAALEPGGLVERLRSTGERSLAGVGGAPVAAMTGILAHAGVLHIEDGAVSLSPAFAATLAARGAHLRARLDFIALATADLMSEGTGLFLDLQRFMARSRTFAMFRYDLAARDSPEAIAAARPFVAYVTARTVVEAPLLAPAIPVDTCRTIVEIGGNTGVFALALLERAPQARALVVDLPAVCALGRAAVAGHPLAGRLSFVAADARRDPWPAPADLVVFKSVLHDWPEPEARVLLERAAASLAPGGRIVVCEREPLDPADPRPGVLRAEEWVFAPFFRPPDLYVEAMAAQGLRVEVARPSGRLPFFLVTGRRS